MHNTANKLRYIYSVSQLIIRGKDEKDAIADDFYD